MRGRKCTLVHSHQKASCNYLNHGRGLCNHFLSILFCCLRKCCYICIVYPVNRSNSLICSVFSIKHHEEALADGVAALRVGQMRLYCLYFDKTAVFFGSGGFKPPEIRSYQEDPVLNMKAQQMRDIAAKINKAIIDKDIVIEEDGSLTINFWDDEDD